MSGVVLQCLFAVPCGDLAISPDIDFNRQILCALLLDWLGK